MVYWPNINIYKWDIEYQSMQHWNNETPINTIHQIRIILKVTYFMSLCNCGDLTIFCI